MSTATLSVEGSRTKDQKSALETAINQFRRDIGGTKGLTPIEKKHRAEDLLHRLREDREGQRTVSPQRSDDLRKYLRFVLTQAEEALARQRGQRA